MMEKKKDHLRLDYYVGQGVSRGGRTCAVLFMGKPPTKKGAVDVCQVGVGGLAQSPLWGRSPLERGNRKPRSLQLLPLSLPPGPSRYWL